MTEQTPQHLRLVASNDDDGDTPASPTLNSKLAHALNSTLYNT